MKNTSKLAGQPDIAATSNAICQLEGIEREEEHRARICNLIASCIKPSGQSKNINGMALVLRDGEVSDLNPAQRSIVILTLIKIFVDTSARDSQEEKHFYAGYYLPYPGAAYEGLVTTITPFAPIMNWVYVDATTFQLKYGTKRDADPNLTGPFNCTGPNHRLSFMDWEGFCAVDTDKGWAIYFDIDDNGLKGKVPTGTRVLELELSRREKRWSDYRTGQASVKGPERVDSGFEDTTELVGEMQRVTSISRPTSLAISLSCIEQTPALLPATLYREPTPEKSPERALMRKSTFELIRAPLTPSPTFVRVFPPVILSTYRLPSSSTSSRHSRGSSHRSESSRQQRRRLHNQDSRSSHRDATFANFTRPLSLSLTSNIFENEKGKPGSKMRAILRSLSGSKFRSRKPASDWEYLRRRPLIEPNKNVKDDTPSSPKKYVVLLRTICCSQHN
jgi:hypothetical protein